MPRKSSIAIFIAATSALAISSPVNAGEKDLGGLKEWNTDMSIDADFILDEEEGSYTEENALRVHGHRWWPAQSYTSPLPPYLQAPAVPPIPWCAQSATAC